MPLFPPAASGLENFDGWIDSSYTWVYASATSFTISGVDMTGTLVPGTAISYNDGSVDYGTVVSSSFGGGNTTVNLIPNNDYSISNTTLTAARYSFAAAPPGYPANFTYTPSLTGYSVAPSDTSYYYSSTGPMINLVLAENTNGTSNANNMQYTAPATASTQSGTAAQWQFSGAGANSGALLGEPCLARILDATNVVNVFSTYAPANWATTGGKRLRSTCIIYTIG